MSEMRRRDDRSREERSRDDIPRNKRPREERNRDEMQSGNSISSVRLDRSRSNRSCRSNLIQSKLGADLLYVFTIDWVNKVEKLTNPRAASGVSLLLTLCQQLKMEVPELVVTECGSLGEVKFVAEYVGSGEKAASELCSRIQVAKSNAALEWLRKFFKAIQVEEKYFNMVKTKSVELYDPNGQPETIRCPNCQIHFTYNEIGCHLEDCNAKVVEENLKNAYNECQLCKASIQNRKMQQHTELCAAQWKRTNGSDIMMYCPICDCDLWASELLMHGSKCYKNNVLASKVECGICEEKVKWVDYNQHLAFCKVKQRLDNELKIQCPICLELVMQGITVFTCEHASFYQENQVKKENNEGLRLNCKIENP